MVSIPLLVRKALIGRMLARRASGRTAWVATFLSVLFLAVALGGVGYVWYTLANVQNFVGRVDIPAVEHLYPVVQSAEVLNDSLTEYLRNPSQNTYDAVQYAAEVTLYETQHLEQDKRALADLPDTFPISDVTTLVVALSRVLNHSARSPQPLSQIAAQIGNAVASLTNAYSDLTYTVMTRDNLAIKTFGYLSVVTRIVVLLIVAGLLFVTVVVLLQRQYVFLLDRAHRETERARTEAEKANQAKSDFLATISHEIRTPMNAITALTHLALGYEHDPRLKDFLLKIQGSANTLLQIINEVLDFSRIESGKVELEEINFSLDEVFESLSAIVAVKAQEKGLEVLFRSAADVPSNLRGDPVRLGQILINLGNNAVKFTDAGEICVSVRVDGRTEEAVLLHFAVRDTGIGVEPNKQSKIFEAFSQADSTTTRKYEGTGLGLSISKNLVEMMGGQIGLASEPGAGSTFSFTARFALQPSSALDGQDRRPGLLGVRALVVDDNELARELLVEMLQALSVQTETAASGSDAVKVLASSGPDFFHLVLVDYLMPEMTGIDTIAEIRELARGSARPKIVLLTPIAHAGVVTEAEARGIDAVLVKPVSPSRLLQTIVALGHEEVVHGPPAHASLEKQETADATEGVRLLLVEDNDLNQQVIREILENNGFRVTVADSGSEALRILRSEIFHAVLLDIHMPGMDGYETARHIRENERDGHLPILAMTASALARDRERSLAAGMDDHIVKPVSPQELISKLTHWVTSTASVPFDISSTDNSAPTDSAAPLAVKTLDREEALARLAGNEVLLEELYRKFRRNNRRATEEIRDLLRSNMLESAHRRAHSIKGIAGNLGAQPLYAAAEALETVLSQDISSSGAEEHLSRFDAELAALMAELDSTLPPER